MTFNPKRMLALTLAIPAALSVGACASGTLAIPVALDCSGRIPPGLKADVPHAAFPKDNTVGEMARFGDEEAGQLDRANDAKATVVWIVDRCEEEERAAAKAIDNRPFWQKWMKPLRPG